MALRSNEWFWTYHFHAVEIETSHINFVYDAIQPVTTE